MTGQSLEDIYDAAARRHPKGFVSVESFRNILDELQANEVECGKHPLAL